jgi:small subunit ribosomal protein S1
LRPLKVIEADQRRDRLILSEKAAAQPPRGQREGIEPTTRPGESVRVLIAGLDKERGSHLLIELAPRRIETPSELVHSGDLVRVRVVAIDAERRRLSLSIREAAGNVVYATRTDQGPNV